ncbi:tRNA (adenine(58)-N(1))-methyltransferase, mitochondrial [Megalops cyprinoides]|uniref:tRNA (adenine(58)-N(1))-methyltransferase, mitochondrial n=1 Tax=Megalops cyprinoides TaxID=118141 RepID=UPI001863F7EB|nr:tRNA (adenine(58)-N(1))-methyltransferase, mitochondrial [Megalops cyprinoides]
MMWGGTPMERYCWRLVRICATCGGKQGYRGLLPREGVFLQTWGMRSIRLGSEDHSEDESSKDRPESSHPSPQQSPSGPPPGRLGARRRPLSPLERISRLLPQDTLSQEVWELRKSKQEVEGQRMLGDMQVDPQTPGASAEVTGIQGLGSSVDVQLQEDRLSQRQEGVKEEESSAAGLMVEESSVNKEEEKQDQAEGDPSPALPGERPFCLGEFALAELRKKGQVAFQKMFLLQERGFLNSTWGKIHHSAIVGHYAGNIHRTSVGFPILLRRPSLEEYVLLMKRGPAIAYPKDVSAMLMMMDVTEGDCVLESGSGSGAMSLFLSRAVGARGSVLSVEVREDHYRRAVTSYQRWRSSWSVRRGEEWPDNVQFHNTDLRAAASLLAGRGFNAVALDMVNPQLVLPTVYPHLHNGAVCAVYLANVTQVIDLLEGIRHTELPLFCERVIEVQHRDWLLAPAVMKDGKYALRVAPSRGSEKTDEANAHDQEKAESGCQENMQFGTVPYIARPHPEQMSHTAFLVKLRKVSQL